MNDISWGDAIFVATFGSLVVWGSVVLGFLTANLMGLV